MLRVHRVKFAGLGFNREYTYTAKACVYLCHQCFGTLVASVNMDCCHDVMIGPDYQKWARPLNKRRRAPSLHSSWGMSLLYLFICAVQPEPVSI